MPESGIDRVVFYLLQDLMCDVHGPESIYFGYARRSVGQDRFTELFQFKLYGVDFRYRRIGKCDCFFSVRGLDIKRKDVQVLRRLQLYDLGFLIQKIDTNIGIFLE